jgi:hypothetical protein
MHRKFDANDKSPISEIATQHMTLIPISTPNMMWSNFATRTFVGRIKITNEISRERSDDRIAEILPVDTS